MKFFVFNCLFKIFFSFSTATVIVRLMITVTEIEKGSKYGVDADKFNSEKAE